MMGMECWQFNLIKFPGETSRVLTTYRGKNWAMDEPIQWKTEQTDQIIEERTGQMKPADQSYKHNFKILVSLLIYWIYLRYQHYIRMEINCYIKFDYPTYRNGVSALLLGQT